MNLRFGLLLALAGCAQTNKGDTGPADQDGDGYTVLLDCDDTSAAIHPGATEVCDGLDDDCDGQIDNGGETARFADGDRDGYGDPASPLGACDSAGVAEGTDCDDADANISPAGEEVADGVDNNCDGSIDEGFAEDTGGDTGGDTGRDTGHDTGVDSGRDSHTGGWDTGDSGPPETGWGETGVWRDTGDWGDTGDVGHDTGGGSTGGSPSFDAYWEGDLLVVTIYGGRGSYELGIAETDPASADPWTGEDCLDGYITAAGAVYLYCHPLTSTGGTFKSGGSPTALDEDTETVFYPSLLPSMTFAVWSDDTFDCWTWGADTRYYTFAGCMAL